jgi:uncharacterized protein
MKTIEDIKNALLSSNFEVLKEVINEYNINEIDSSGDNILHYYIKSSDTFNLDYKSVIDLFVSKGIDINQKQIKGSFKRSPLHIAVFNKQFDITDYLIKLGADVNSTDANGNNPLMTAVMWYNDGNDSLIKTLIEKGADINQENNHGRTAKLDAMENDGNEDIHKYFK